jgi:phytoene dehydrogenase-like protein
MPVKRIIIENGRATGVETEAGERFDSLMVISNADPKTTLMKLIGAKHAETGFARRVSHLRAKGNAAKLHLGCRQSQGCPGRTMQSDSSLHPMSTTSSGRSTRPSTARVRRTRLSK